MFRIKTRKKITPAGLSVLDKSRFTVSDDAEYEDGILVRSADMQDYPFPENLRAIARAGAGTNNIPIARCSEAGIVVFNTPGANANAVKELGLCGMLLASRKVTRAIVWCKTIKDEGDNVPKTVEKGKSAFAGPELKGKTFDSIDLSGVGVLNTMSESLADYRMAAGGFAPGNTHRNYLYCCIIASMGTGYPVDFIAGLPLCEAVKLREAENSEFFE